MGLLKHFVLPFFAVLHLFVAFTCYYGDRPAGRASLVEAFHWPPNSVESDGLTMYEQHAFGIIGGAHAALGFAALIGLLHEHSHFPPLVAMMEMIYWGLGGLDAALLGFPCVAAYVFTGLGGLGLVLHMKERGLLTKDKEAGKQKSHTF